MILPSDEAGQGRPVVLLHARPVDRTMWRGHLPLLAQAGVRAIALDLPGHGDVAAAQRAEVAPWADVLDTLDHLGADRFTLAGVAADPLTKDGGALRTLPTPTLVGVGEFDMPDFFEGGAVLSNELGSGEVAVLADAGHLAPLEQPEAFCAPLLDFVGRLPA
ncbi:alpha/beta fold hydrolase [Amycolatopsis sp. NPDC005961]|uniref:alpha/beta fold hydrolase n=1 Tax=Amycolatopsis sp. NPDC005961 TaxID=3156720 RepID=UPI003405F2BE